MIAAVTLLMFAVLLFCDLFATRFEDRCEAKQNSKVIKFGF